MPRHYKKRRASKSARAFSLLKTSCWHAVKRIVRGAFFQRRHRAVEEVNRISIPNAALMESVESNVRALDEITHRIAGIVEDLRGINAPARAIFARGRGATASPRPRASFLMEQTKCGHLQI